MARTRKSLLAEAAARFGTDAVKAAARPSLTPAQQRVCDALKARGEIAYNGRMGKLLRNLRALNLVVFDYDLVPHSRGGFTERYTARLANEPGQPRRAPRR